MLEGSRKFYTRKKILNSESNIIESEWYQVDIRLEDTTGSSERFAQYPVTSIVKKEETLEDLIEAPELPELYGKDTLVILARDPFSSFCYWEIMDNTLATIKSKIKKNNTNKPNFLLRLYRLSELNSSNPVYCFEQAVEVDGNSGNTYIDYSAPYNLFYGKIGYHTENEDFLSLVTSEIPKDIPPESPYPVKEDMTEEDWFTIELKDGIPQVKILPPRPLPEPLISFDLLLTEQIKPKVMAVIHESEKGKEEKISSRYKLFEKSEKEKIGKTTWETIKMPGDINKFIKDKIMNYDNPEKISEQTFESQEFSESRIFEDISLQFKEIIKDKKTIEKTHNIQKFMSQISPDKPLDTEKITAHYIKNLLDDKTFLYIHELLKIRLMEEIPFPFTGSPSS